MRKRLEKGQASVEFAVFSIILVILLLIPVQLAWIGVQKWQFTHFGAVAARTWSVHTKDSYTTSIISVQGRAILRGWEMFNGRLWVSPMIAQSPTTKSLKKGDGNSVSQQVFRVRGMAMVIPIFKPFFALSGDWGYSGWEALPYAQTRLLISGIGMVDFEGNIPMEKEPTEEPNNKRRDNDCDGTPCTGGNGR